MPDNSSPSDLHEKARAVLWALYSNNGTADTSQIRERAGFVPQLISYHVDALTEHDLVERVGTRDVGKPSDANVYRLTDAGTSIAEVIGADPIEGPDLQVMVRDMASRIEALEESHNELADVVERIDERQEKIAEYLKAKGREEEKRKQRQNQPSDIDGIEQY